MAPVKDFPGRGRDVARRVRARVGRGGGDQALLRRVERLETEVQECRQLNLRLAELTDVVQELLLPVAQRDEDRVREIVEKYSKGV